MRRTTAMALLLGAALLGSACVVPSLVERQAQWAAVGDAAFTLVWKDTLREEGQAEAVGRQVRYVVDSRAAAWVRGQEVGVAVLTTPSIAFLGVEFNPVARMTPRELLERVVEAGQEALGGGQHAALAQGGLHPEVEGEEAVGLESSLGTLEGSRFRVRAGEHRAVVVVVKGKHQGDLVVVGAVLADPPSDAAWGALTAALGSLAHPAEPGEVQRAALPTAIPQGVGR